MADVSTHRLTADAHVLTLLGDELIGNDLLAVFELVKNAYDADATKVVVDMLLSDAEPTIRVRDNGSGMTQEILTQSWMRLGTSFKRGNAKKPSPVFGRMPLGEKGVGRLAVQKLGTKARLVTRTRAQQEFSIAVDWSKMLRESGDLTDLTFELERLEKPAEFTGDEHGTLIEIRGLHRPEWPTRDLRALKRLLVSLKSPFEDVTDFDVILRVPGREDELANVLEIRDILNRANWSFEFELDALGRYNWSYEFHPPTAFAKQLSENKLKAIAPEDRALAAAKLPNPDLVIRDPATRGAIHVTADDLKGIGPVKGRLYVYDRRRESFESGTFTQMRQFLDEQTGIRIYRDGVRVFNYGEPGEDWLFLNASRINRPVERMGTNSVIGAVHLTLSESRGLREKTNREGFDENVTFARLRWIMQSVVSHLDNLRREDREKLNAVMSGKVLEDKAAQKKPFETVLAELRTSVKKHKLDRVLGGQLDFIESGYREMRDVLARSAGALNLALVFHEVEREVNLLKRAIDKGDDREALRKQASHVVGLLDAIGGLLRQTQKRKTTARALLGQVVSLNEARFKHHGIAFSCPVLTGEDKDFEIFGPVNLYLAGLNNLVDNAIYWTRTAAELSRTVKPAIVVRTLPGWFKDGNAIVVADNGRGFRIETEQAVQAGVTTKPGGMGLGLYYANLVMESTGGELVIGDAGDFDLSEIYSGATVALKFKKVGAS